MPRLALASWPVISQLTVVREFSASCSKVTVPLTLESPRTTATIRRTQVSIETCPDTGTSSRRVQQTTQLMQVPIKPHGYPASTSSRHTSLDRWFGPSVVEAIKVIVCRASQMCSIQLQIPRPTCAVETEFAMTALAECLPPCEDLRTSFDHFDGCL